MKTLLLVISALSFPLSAFSQSPTPTASPTATPIVLTKVSVQWNPSPDSSVVSYNVYASKTADINAAGKFTSPIAFQVQASTTTYAFTNLVDGTYYFAVTAVNGAGLESVYSNIITASLQSQPPGPVTGLRFVSQSATPQTAKRTARIDWQTTEPSTGKVYYGPSKFQMNHVVLDPKVSTTHKVKLTGLTKGGSYVYQIKATSKKGAIALTELADFRLP
jgi:hypothetical protein